MTETTIFSDYGYRELRRLSQKYAGVALGISAGIHFFFGGSYIAVTKFLDRPKKEVTVRIVRYTELGPPPSITNAPPPPQLAVTAPVTRPTVGIPKPVPDAEVSPEQTIATQTEMAQQPAPITSEGDGETIQIDVGDDPLLGEFVAVEEQPVLIHQVKPVYPELARKAGIEGIVYVQMLIDIDGRVKKAVILKGTDMFNDAAVEAAKQWIFKPAINANQPVKVWTVQPFRFTLKDASAK